MALKFEYVINLTENGTNVPPPIGAKASMVHTLEGKLDNYYLNGKTAETKTFVPVDHLNDYDNIYYEGKQLKLTARAVSDTGIKTFPGIGPYGFFTYAYENASRVIIPIEKDYGKYSPVMLQMTEYTDTLLFTITPPDDIAYSCYRIILRNGAFAFEYITYETSVVLPKPGVKGTYNIFCIGYVNEGSYVSYDSNVITYEVTTGQDTFEPSSGRSYFTKQQILELLAEVVPEMANYYTKDQVDEVDNKLHKEVLLLDGRVATIEQSLGDVESLVDIINGEVI